MNLLVLNSCRKAASSLLFQKLAQKSPSPSVLFKGAPLAYKPIQFAFNVCTKRPYSTAAPININLSNLTKDVIVYKYENPRYFKLLNIFAIVQFVFWTMTVEFQMSQLRDTPVDETVPDFSELPLYKRKNLGSDKYKYGLAFVFVFIAIAILSVSWLFTLKSVRYLIMRKGGTKVSFVTYGPLGTNRIMDVPLRCVTAIQPRGAVASYLPLKVKGKALYYILDKKGIYTNPEIFDHVINVRRRF